MKTRLSYLSSLLFSTLSPKSNLHERETTTVLMATPPSTTAETPSLKSLLSSYQDTHKELLNAPIYRNYSPTIKFSFVLPPSSHVDNTSLDDSDLFEWVRCHYGSDTPIAVYLPGLDCSGISAVSQFPGLASKFELWRMSVTTDDRSKYSEVVDAILQFLADVSIDGKRNVTLIGESFGGQVAPIVALRLQNSRNRVPWTSTSSPSSYLQGMVLINPATSFDDTSWDLLGPLLTYLQAFGTRPGANPYTVLGGMALATLIPDSTQLRTILEIILGSSLQSNQSPQELLQNMDTAFASLGNRLPPGLVLHRVKQWLTVGASLLSDQRLASISIPTLVVAGEDDRFLPSKREAERLTKLLPNCKKLIVPGAGHFVLDQRVNLTEAILYSDIDPFRLRSPKKYDPILDWKPPSEENWRKKIESIIQPLRKLTSPVFFTTDENGKRWMGLGKLPVDHNPIVFVANHQLFGLDLSIIVSQLIEDRNIFPRGLGHPVLFMNNNDTTWYPEGRPDSPGLVPKDATSQQGILNNPQTFREFGAVQVSPKNYFRLLQSGQTVLLFPGGVREVFHGKDEAYQLFWPTDKSDFVRTAVKFNATIIPISAVGAADSVRILLDAQELVKLPFGVGDTLRDRSNNITSARFSQTNDEELFVPPLLAPKLSPPARHYFVFGKPFRTTEIDSRNLEDCQMLYQNVKQELERGLKDVLRARELDPYRDPTARLSYEVLTGKSPPTFSIDEMNKM